ncbi:MAG: hypothetical protein J6E41_03495, partial [Lachnospiraceae bacterium]|nr:hypothetical protein [Lachnospiraceae bacterium]
MKNVFFSIDAFMVLNGENIRGILNIDTQRIKFVSNESVLIDKSVNWDKLEHTIKKEIVRKFFLFSTTYYLISFTENGISLPSFHVEEKHGEAVVHAIDNIKKVFIEQKEYQLKLEEERLNESESQRLELQNKYEDALLLEVERLEAEHLKEEKRQNIIKEERRKETERLE